MNYVGHNVTFTKNDIYNDTSIFEEYNITVCFAFRCIWYTHVKRVNFGVVSVQAYAHAVCHPGANRIERSRYFVIFFCFVLFGFMA